MAEPSTGNTATRPASLFDWPEKPVATEWPAWLWSASDWNSHSLIRRHWWLQFLELLRTQGGEIWQTLCVWPIRTEEASWPITADWVTQYGPLKWQDLKRNVWQSESFLRNKVILRCIFAIKPFKPILLVSPSEANKKIIHYISPLKRKAFPHTCQHGPSSDWGSFSSSELQWCGLGSSQLNRLAAQVVPAPLYDRTGLPLTKDVALHFADVNYNLKYPLHSDTFCYRLAASICLRSHGMKMLPLS